MVEACLNEDSVLAFLNGDLAPDGRARIEAHLASCEDCAEVATWAAADYAHASREPGREGRPFVGQLTSGARVGRYQILAPVGRGGMGEVYAAYHPDLDRRIALKVVYESAAHGAEHSARLLREARAIARLSHPNVVAVYDAGTVDERVYIAMEFVDGDTLDEWLRAKPRSWRAVVDVFIAAGQGLAAAHAAEIVHRDFKPQNVMIGKDGNVRVMDFGLARLVGDAAGAAPPANAAPPEREAVGGDPDDGATPSPTAAAMTKTGALLGTPAYMAPEQFRGEPADARADQFSFCVTLHEALCGERPILAHRLAGATDSGGWASTTNDSSTRTTRQSDQTSPVDRRSALARASIPSWLRSVVRRGLADDPSARFPSLAALLTALQRGRNRVRRRALATAATGALALVALTGWRAAHPLRFDCRPPADRIAAAWPIRDPTHPRRQAIEKVFLASGRPDSETLWQRFASTLDDYLGRWTRMYTEACEATHHRGEQSTEVLDLRMRCLNENLDDVRALTDVVTSGSIESQALAAASGLVPVSRCADLTVLRSIVPLPRDEMTLRKVQALEQSVREIRSTYELGRWREALSKARAIRRAVEATGYKPLLADLLARTGIVEDTTGDPAHAESTLFDAVAVGVASGDEHAAAMASAILVSNVGYVLGRHTEGRRWAQFARGLLDRLGSDRLQIESWVLMGEGSIDAQEHRLKEAVAKFSRAYELAEIALGKDHPQLSIPLSNLGIITVESGDPGRALSFLDRAIALSSRYGQPNGIELGNRAEALHALDRNSEARQDFERSIVTAQNDFYLSAPLTGLGIVNCETGQSAAAVPLLEKALRIREAQEPDAVLVAETRFALARALWNSGGSHERAISLARAAKSACGDDPCPRRLSGLESWLRLRGHPNDRMKVARH